MNGFLYYKPNHSKQPTPQELRAWGVAYAFETPPEGTVCMTNTPDGGQGFVFGESARHEMPILMNMPEQTWRPLHGGLYLGYWSERKPTEADLLRSLWLEGGTVLIEGFEWKVPLIRRFDKPTGALHSALPCYVEMNDNGEPVEGDVIAEYAELWQVSAQHSDMMLQAVASNGVFPKPDAAAWRTIARILQANYLVDLPELVALRALTSGVETMAVLMAACDIATALDWHRERQKKTDSCPAIAGSTITDGDAA